MNHALITKESLVSLQESALILMLRQRTSERRTRKMHASVLHAYRLAAAKKGYTPEQIDQQVRDIRDMVTLELNAD